MMKFFLTTILASEKSLCAKKQHTVTTGFYQRIELPNEVECVERCIENIAYCKAVLFIPPEDEERFSINTVRLLPYVMKTGFCYARPLLVNYFARVAIIAV